jgi:3-oxoacyl-[acyl-carrier-protein] synthase II
MTDADRVVIVGAGVVAPAGVCCTDFLDGLLSGRSFTRHLDLEICDGEKAIGGAVSDESWLGVLAHTERRRCDRIVQLGLAAAREALDQAGLARETVVDPFRFGAVVGIGFGGVSMLLEAHEEALAQGWRRISPFGIPAVMPSSLAGAVAIDAGIRGPVSTVSSACASGTHAIVDATRLIRNGLVDVALVGGSEAPLNSFAINGFARMAAISTRFDEPEAASRPFDVDRDGFVIGEGSGFVVLESLRSAQERGVTILGEVLGVGMTNDARHITAPDDTGEAARRAVTDALVDGQLDPTAVVHVNAHGTGTELNDLAESRVLVEVFGGSPPPVTSVKGAIGHLMGGAGAVEFVAALLAARSRLVPPTANCEVIDPRIELDVVQREPRPVDLGPFLSCSFGFGGQNVAVVATPQAPVMA